MAKMRDHKVFVTDEAIEKVPLIKYKEIPESSHIFPIKLHDADIVYEGR